jgi:hypothetical protein
MESRTYLAIGNLLGAIAGLITFVGAWWYCAANYGFLLGFGLGWLPAAISAALVWAAVALLWGLALALFAIWIVFVVLKL